MYEIHPDPQQRRLKLISDGTARGSQLVDLQTGAPIAGVVKINWELGYGRPVVTVSLTGVEVEVVHARWPEIAAKWPSTYPDIEREMDAHSGGTSE